MADAWRKAGFDFDDRGRSDATGIWERERADAEDVFALPRPAATPRESRGDVPPPVTKPSGEAAPRLRRRASGDPPTLEDELSALVWRVFIAPATPLRTIMFCGADAEQPSDRIAAVAAEALAAHRVGTVCFVDETHCSASIPRLAAPHFGRFGETSADGNSEGERRVSENLWATGSRLSSGGDRSATGDRLRGLRKQFDYVIVAAPAALAGSDAMTMAGSVEGIILLIDENATRREAARTAIERFQESAGRVLGVILTNRSYPIPRAIYRRL
jgi:hypothetical protein